MPSATSALPAGAESARTLWWRATLDILPLSISVIPWGILCGALALQVGLSPLQAQCMSLLVYAGAAQLSATTLFGVGTPLLPIMGSTFVITSQHLLYGFTFRRDVLPLALRWRASLAFFLTDEMFAVALKDRERSGAFNPAYALIAGFVFYLFWNLATLLGIAAGQYIDGLDKMGLDFAIAATFIAMTIPALKNLPMVAATLVSGGTALLTKPLLAEVYIIISALAGMVVGYVLHRMRR
ncbi:AzlC family ABC transporter permease [Aeromonas salmonicida]|uniref:AzlC family ABC transporter permease n=1 Tax=Aeromonas salmonicida TaxID=645 RepID=UPI001BADE8EC|nr:AzlC family ABC transporter permease [Aeromonas salmonicida]MBS2781566.1 AzlC family ABC transporter permease [Aeromonas salmonicida]